MKLFVKWALVALACSALVVGCGKKKEEEEQEETATAVIVQ